MGQLHWAIVRHEQRLILALVLLGTALSSAGQDVRVADGDRRNRLVLVSIPDRKLAVLEGEDIIATFPIAVGAAISPSPTGEFRIITRVSNPAYYRPAR